MIWTAQQKAHSEDFIVIFVPSFMYIYIYLVIYIFSCCYIVCLLILKWCGCCLFFIHVRNKQWSNAQQMNINANNWDVIKVNNLFGALVDYRFVWTSKQYKSEKLVW